MTPEEFKGYYKAAKLNYDSGLDIPPSISERARAGLLGAHIIAARDESVYLEDSDFLYVLDLMIKDDQ